MNEPSDKLDFVAKLLDDVLDIPNEHVSENSTLVELGIDSLDAVELMVSIEERLGVPVDDDEFSKIKSVKDIMEFIDEIQKI